MGVRASYGAGPTGWPGSAGPARPGAAGRGVRRGLGGSGWVGKVLGRESRYPVPGRGAAASQWRVLWPEGIGNLSARRGREAERDGPAVRKCSRGCFQCLSLACTPTPAGGNGSGLIQLKSNFRFSLSLACRAASTPL